MNKIASILVLSLLFSVTLSQAAAAQDIMEWFAKDQSWPPFGSNTQDNFPRWLIGLFIVTIGSLILLAVSRIKLLQESSYKNAVLALSFGIAAIAVSATTIVNNFVAIFGLTSWLAVILATISLGSLFIGLMTKGAGLGVKLGGEGVREGVAAIKGDEKKEKRDEQDENAMLSSLKSFGQQQFKQIEQVKNYLLEVDSLIQSHSQELMNDKSGLRKKLLADLNQVQTRLHTLKIEEHKVDAIISRLKSDVVDEINVFKEELQQEAQKRTQLNPQTVRNIEREVEQEIQKVIAEFRMLPELKKFVADLKDYLADAISYFQQGVEAIRSGNITLAGGEFQTALTRIEEMESELANLDDAERELRLRIRDVYDNDAKKNLILARAGVH